MTFTTRPFRGILTGILTGALALTIAPPGNAGTADVIVRGTDLASAVAAVTEHGGDVELEIGLINGVSASVPSSALAALSSDARVLDISLDAPVSLADHDEDEDEDEDDRDEDEDTEKAAKEQAKADEKAAKEQAKADEKAAKEQAKADEEAAKEQAKADEEAGKQPDLKPRHRGVTPEEASHALGGRDMDDITNFDGTGIDVAVIDSGVKPGKALSDARIIKGIDLSAGGGPRDGYGHGTVMASIIAGDTDAYEGVAREARIVDVKVADRNGMSDVSQVLAGLDWVVSNRNANGLNIRVASLSFGTDGINDYATSPLAYAVEAAWRHGIVVVVSAGNHGTELGRLTSPAIDPYVITVGAADLTNVSGPHDLDNAVVPSFSASGDGIRNPDLVAPGRSLLGTRAADSKIEWDNPNSREGDYILGSGTSHATAFTAGVVAAMLEARPSLTPDEVKALLTSTAHDLKNVPARRDGAGVLNLAALFPGGHLAPTPANATQSHGWSDGTGSLDGDRGSFFLEDEDGNVLTGDHTVVGPFDREAWAGSTWSGSTWSGSTWSGSTWSGSTWSGSTWSGSTWSGSTWSGSTWSGSTWSSVRWGE